MTDKSSSVEVFSDQSAVVVNADGSVETALIADNDGAATAGSEYIAAICLATEAQRAAFIQAVLSRSRS